MPSCPVFYQTPPQAQEPELWQREGEILNLGFAPVCQGDEEEAPGRGLGAHRSPWGAAPQTSKQHLAGALMGGTAAMRPGNLLGH